MQIRRQRTSRSTNVVSAAAEQRHERGEREGTENTELHVRFHSVGLFDVHCPDADYHTKSKFRVA